MEYLFVIIFVALAVLATTRKLKPIRLKGRK
jgi:hypothetical protein